MTSAQGRPALAVARPVRPGARAPAQLKFAGGGAAAADNSQAFACAEPAATRSDRRPRPLVTVHGVGRPASGPPRTSSRRPSESAATRRTVTDRHQTPSDPNGSQGRYPSLALGRPQRPPARKAPAFARVRPSARCVRPGPADPTT